MCIRFLEEKFFHSNSVHTLFGILLVTSMVPQLLGASPVETQKIDKATHAVEAYVRSGTPRVRHSSTGLLDGRVLVVGGTDLAGNSVEPAAETFNPISGSWLDVATAEGDISPLIERTFHTGTALRDGRILIIGGFQERGGQAQPLRDCLLFSPDQVGSSPWQHLDLCLQIPRGQHTTTRLHDGRLLVTGGLSVPCEGPSLECPPENGHRSVEICEVTGNHIDCRPQLDALAYSRFRHTATRMQDGRVWISGGRSSEDVPIHDVFHPQTETWNQILGVSTRFDHTTIALENGHLVTVGGIDSTDTYEVWSQETLDLQDAGSLDCSYGTPAAAGLLPDDSFVLFEGTLPGCVQRCSVEGGQLQCSRLPDLKTSRPRMTANYLPGGRFLLLGASTDSSSSGSMYNLPMQPSSIVDLPMGSPRYGHSSTILADGKLLVAGDDSYEILEGSEAGYSWTLPQPLPDFRRFHTSTLLEDGSVILIGGVNASGSPLGTTAIFTPGIGWAQGPEMDCPRFKHSATRLWDSRVLVVGGEGECSDSGPYSFHTFEVFDPDPASPEESWSPALLLPDISTRIAHSATLLSDGRVIVTGGESGPGTDDAHRVDFFDPEQDLDSAWRRATAPLLLPRNGHFTNSPAEGQVLLVGGSSPGFHDEYELLTIEDGSHQFSSQIVRAAFPSRIKRAYTQLSDRRLLAIGGTSETGSGFSSHVLDIATQQSLQSPRIGTWVRAFEPSFELESHSVTALFDQKILVSGGLFQGSPTANAILIDLKTPISSPDETKIVSISLVGDETTALDIMASTSKSSTIPQLVPNQGWVIRGRGLLGKLEGSGGQGSQNSDNSIPTVELRSLENNQTLALGISKASDDRIVTLPFSGFTPGPGTLTVLVNGRTSLSIPIQVLRQDPDPQSVEAINLAASITNSTDLAQEGSTIATTLEIRNLSHVLASDAYVSSSIPNFFQPDQLTCSDPQTLASITEVDERPPQVLAIDIAPGAFCRWLFTSTAQINDELDRNLEYSIGISSGIAGVWQDPILENNVASAQTYLFPAPSRDMEEVIPEADRPAAAASVENYLVVYEDSTETDIIRGRYLDPTGASTAYGELAVTGISPDVTYDHRKSKYFLTWIEELDIAGETQQCLKVGKILDTLGNIELLSNGNECEPATNPAIASTPRGGQIDNLDSETWIVFEKAMAGTSSLIGIFVTTPEYTPDEDDTIFPIGPIGFGDVSIKPRIAAKSNDLVAVTWQDMSGNVYATAFSPKAPPSIFPVVQVDSDGADGEHPDIAYDEKTGRFYIVWNESPDKIMARFLEAQASGEGTSIELGNITLVDACDTQDCEGFMQERPRVDCHNARCSVAWERSTPVQDEIVARLFTTTGAFLGEEFRVDIAPDNKNQRLPAVVFAPEGNQPDSSDHFLVAWAGGQEETPESSVRARVFPIHSLLLESESLGRKFEITVNWTTPEPPPDEGQSAQRIPVQPLENVGFFWFYDPQNIEVLVKLLDVAGDPWVAYASLTERPFEIAVRECDDNNGCGEISSQVIPSIEAPHCGGLAVIKPATEDLLSGKGMTPECQPSNTNHCLFDRFATRVRWKGPSDTEFQEAFKIGNVLDSSEGSFSLGEADVASAVFSFGLAGPQVNPEVALKMVQNENDYFIYYGAATDLEYQIEIDDTACTTEDCETLIIHSPEDPYCGGNLFRQFPPVPDP